MVFLNSLRNESCCFHPYLRSAFTMRFFQCTPAISLLVAGSKYSQYPSNMMQTLCLAAASSNANSNRNQTVTSLSPELHALSRRADDTTTLRVLPIGASIVYGYASSDGNGFRYPLRNALVQGGRDVNVRINCFPFQDSTMLIRFR